MTRDLITKKEVATEVISHDVTPLTVNTDAGAYSKLGWVVVLAGVFGFILWAMFAPLDKGVPMPGTVIKEGNRKTIQHLSGGIIEDILVKDGDVVVAGQILVRMNKVNVNAQVEIARAQYITARTMEARLVAERDGLNSFVLPAKLVPYKEDPRVVASMSTQGQLLSSRRQALHNELSALDETMAGIRAQLVGTQESRESKKIQLAIIKEQLNDMRELAKDGYIARNRLLDLERNYAQIAGAISEDQGNIGHAQRQISELTLRRVQRQQEVQKEVRTQLAETQRDAEGLESRVLGLDYDVNSADVKSPVDGIVVGTSVFTKGGVVGPGMKMMEVVPSADGFVVEGQLPVNLIDRVHTGLKAELVFSAFNGNTTPHIVGVVTQVSADRSLDERSGQPYYKVHASVSPEGVKQIAKLKLNVQPGMPVEMFVKTGERTMMSYLLKPVFDRVKTSMTED